MIVEKEEAQREAQEKVYSREREKTARIMAAEKTRKEAENAQREADEKTRSRKKASDADVRGYRPPHLGRSRRWRS